MRFILARTTRRGTTVGASFALFGAFVSVVALMMFVALVVLAGAVGVLVLCLVVLGIGVVRRVRTGRWSR